MKSRVQTMFEDEDEEMKEVDDNVKENKATRITFADLLETSNNDSSHEDDMKAQNSIYIENTSSDDDSD